MTVTDKVQSLLTAANAKTGESDTNLTDAVQTLVDGYGQGGGSSSEWRLLRDITLAEDTATITITTDEDGNPFEIGEFFIKYWTVGGAAANRGARVMAYGANGDNRHAATLTNSISSAAGAQLGVTYGNIFPQFALQGTLMADASRAVNAQFACNGVAGTETFTKAVRIDIADGIPASNPQPAGTRFIVYGR